MEIGPVTRGFSEAQRPAAARLFWLAFGAKLDRLLGPEDRALEFLAPGLDPVHCLSVSSANGRLLGLAGFKTDDGALVGGSWSDLARSFGAIGAAWRAPLLSLLDRPVRPGVLLMDGLAVAPDARGLGIGSRLLKAVAAEARAAGLQKVRLDVIDSNPRARALYKRHGFAATGTTDAFPFRRLLGFATATRMERIV